MPATTTTAVSKPTYAVMVNEAMKKLGSRTASSVPAIKKQVGAQYKIDVSKISQKALTTAIKKAVESGELVQIKASYKLVKKATPAPAPAKKASGLKKKATSVKTVKDKSVTKTTKKSQPSKVCTLYLFFSLSLCFCLIDCHFFLLLLTGFVCFVLFCLLVVVQTAIKAKTGVKAKSATAKAKKTIKKKTAVKEVKKVAKVTKKTKAKK